MPTGASVIPLRRLVGRNEGELLRREVVGDAPPRRSAKLSLLRVGRDAHGIHGSPEQTKLHRRRREPLFALSGVAGCEKPPTNRLNLYWNLKYIDVRSFILTGAPFS
jgi:hypothetical protein